MPDGIFTPCNVACGSGIVTVNSPSGSNLQCDTWLWDDMPLNSPKRPPHWNSTSGFHFHTSPQSTCHSVPVCEILSKSDHPRHKKITSCRFSRWRISAILDCRDPIMGSLKSPCTISYRSLIETIALNCLVFEKIAFFSFWHQDPRWRISAILDFRGPVMGSLKSPRTTSYRSSIETIAVNCFVFEKIAFFAFWRQTDRRTNRWTAPMH